MKRRFIAVALAVAALSGMGVAAMVDPGAPPVVGEETLAAVFLRDGQAYFGHLDDYPWSVSVTLRDVYYFADASKTTTDLSVGLVQRGTELHKPLETMRIRRDKILAIERVALDSAVAKAIAAQRRIDGSSR